MSLKKKMIQVIKKVLVRAARKMPPMAIPAIFLLIILRGFYGYRYILRHCPNACCKIWFMDYDGSGDTYLTCSCLAAQGLIDQDGIFVASGGLCRRVAELFPFGGFLQIKPRTALAVRLMERFSGLQLRLLPLLYESNYLAHSSVLMRMTGYRGLDFLSMLRVGFEANCGIPYTECPWTPPEFPFDPVKAEDFFQQYGLIPGKTILIAPYAGKHDMWGIPMSFYEELAHRLKTAGFTVCTNSGNPKKEPPIPGTIPILVPYRMIQVFCEKAGCFIGLRSGLCDMISGAKGCKKIILYWGGSLSSVVASHQEFFSLKAMGLCEDAVELEAVGDGWERTLEKIMTILV